MSPCLALLSIVSATGAPPKLPTLLLTISPARVRQPGNVQVSVRLRNDTKANFVFYEGAGLRLELQGLSERVETKEWNAFVATPGLGRIWSVSGGSSPMPYTALQGESMQVGRRASLSSTVDLKIGNHKARAVYRDTDGIVLESKWVSFEVLPPADDKKG